MEANIQDSQGVYNFVTLKDFNWYDECVFHQIVVDHSVENVNLAIIGTGGKQRVTGVELHLSNSLFVESEILVWFLGEIEIEPIESLIV